MSDNLEQWLQEQPLDEPVEIDGETVYLNVHADGAELGANLLTSYTQAQLQDALKQGFQSATRFDAGLGCTPDGNDLVLTQWLPDVSSWSEAADALENLLNQLSMWRAALALAQTKQIEIKDNRDEKRMRSLLAGAK
jgi:hypothetical protein